MKKCRNCSSTLDDQSPVCPICDKASDPVPKEIKKSLTGWLFNPGGQPMGGGVRSQVFEVIVRQGLAGAPWRMICAHPMQVNNIAPEEVEAEIERRRGLMGGGGKT